MLNHPVLAACGGKEGGLATDTFLTNPRRCSFDPATIQCTRGDAPNCLTASELHTVKAYYDGPRNPRTGALIYPGWALGSELGWSGRQGTTTPSFEGIYTWVFGLNYDPRTFDFDHDMATVDAVLAPSVNFLSTDLSRFVTHGGKLLMYHGTADPIVATQDTINYYERIISEQRSTLDAVQSFARLFPVPGMGHCSGGNGPNAFDALSPLVEWVEHGNAPEQIIATKYVNNNASLGVQMARRICAYLKQPHYLGTGDANTAANYVCFDDGRNRVAAELPPREYLAPLVINASAPDVLNLRTEGGKVTVVLTVANGSDTFNQWVPSDVMAEGAVAVSSSLSADGSTYVAHFNRKDLHGFVGGNPDGENVDLMITGVLQHNGIKSLFATSATVKVTR